MKNKKLFIIGGMLLLLMLFVSGVLLFLNNSFPEEDKDRNSFDENLIEMSPEDVGLTLSSQQNNQQLVIEMTNLDEIESFEYELEYDAIENGEVVTQGTFGSGPNPDEEGKSEIRRTIDLGTCSAVCRYHEGVEEILFTLRVDLRNGEAGIIETTHTLE